MQITGAEVKYFKTAGSIGPAEREGISYYIGRCFAGDWLLIPGKFSRVVFLWKVRAAF